MSCLGSNPDSTTDQLEDPKVRHRLYVGQLCTPKGPDAVHDSVAGTREILKVCVDCLVRIPWRGIKTSEAMSAGFPLLLTAGPRPGTKAFRKKERLPLS